MVEAVSLYLHIRHALTADDVQFLREECKRHVSQEGMSCYVSINNLHSTTYERIRGVLERTICEPLYYLNDFYMYTDDSFRADWHIDTELFTFHRAINAWILLSPDLVDDPLGFLDEVNGPIERYFHSVVLEGDRCTFGNYFTGDMMVRSLAAVELERVHTPRVEVGDILAFNPRRFHKTNAKHPKHAIAFKFVMKDRDGFLSACQVDPQFWPEVGIFNRLVNSAHTWDDVIDGIRRTLLSETGRKQLSAGFDPDKLELFQVKVASL